MSNPNVNFPNLDARYTKPIDVDAKIATQATVDAGQYAKSTATYKSFNVRDYGAVGDGVTDDSTAISTAVSAAMATRSLASSQYYGRANIVFPPGRYLVTTANALMNATSGSSTFGIVYEGAGRGVTQIVFSPSTSAAYLQTNTDSLLGIMWRGISFYSTVTDASFMNSYSAGQAQNYNFEDCGWAGTWAAGFALTGTDCNSEFKFNGCNVNGTWTAGFLVVGVNGGSATQDQFLNYWFNNCKIEYDAGYFVNAPYGGNFSFRDCSMILNGTGTFIYLPNQSHADGTQRLKVDGARFETRSTTSLIIDCSWGFGIVHFSNCINDSEHSVVAQYNAVRARFTSLTSASMPNILWENCSLEGKHAYGYGPNSFSGIPRVKYDSCAIRDYDSAHLFISTVDNSSGGTLGGRTSIVFEGCKGSGTFRTPFDCTVNWDVAIAGTPRPHIWRMADQFGNTLPTSAIQMSVILPTNSVPTRLRIYKPAGTGTSSVTGTTYTLQTNEATPTVLATITNASGTWTNWLIQSIIDIPPFMLNSDTKRNLIFKSNNADQQTGTPAFAIVEYLS